MKPKLYFPIFWMLVAFFLFTGNAKGGTFLPPDSTCCPPDSLRVVSTNYPDFCARWDVPDDSTCKKIAGFEVQWKLLAFGTSTWNSQYVAYTSGTSVTFCGSVDTCGTYTWRVRTKCNDSTFSDWVYGPNFSFTCGHDGRSEKSLSVSPNPAYESITVSAGNIKRGRIKISIVSMSGKNVFEKNIYVHGDLLREKLSVSSWRRGLYFVSIIANGIVIRSGSFLKE